MPALTTQNGRYRIASDRGACARLLAGRPHGAGRRGLFAIRLAAAMLWLSSSAAVGQPTPAGTELDEQAIALFKELLKDPTNVDLNFRYAEAAVKLGNYEGAISALERLLLYNPNFPGVKLELAELYTRLASYNTARAYLDQVESAPDATPQTRARVQAIRDQIERATSPSKFAVNLVTGIRHQSDVSAEPAGSDIVAGGIPLTLSSVILHKPGWDAFLGGNVAHTYDLGDATIESNALVYYSKQFRFSSIDSAAIEVNSGPRFDIGGSGASKIVSLRPYALASEVLLGNSQFLWDVGAGLSASRPITEQISAAGFYEFRSERFANVGAVPTATDMDADVHSIGGNLSYQILENGNLGLQVSYAINNARRSFASYDAFVVRATYAHSFQLPAEFGVGPLIVSPVLYRIYSWNGAANPAVAPTVIPITQEWRFGVTGELGLTNNLAATAHVIREVIGSNLPSDRSTDTQVIIGLRLSY
jgi:tetratricopeptide (TPR) repeat protein